VTKKAVKLTRMSTANKANFTCASIGLNLVSSQLIEDSLENQKYKLSGRLVRCQKGHDYYNLIFCKTISFEILTIYILRPTKWNVYKLSG